jgi:glutamine synthetase
VIPGPVGDRAAAANAELKCFDLSANPYLLVGAVCAVATAAAEADLRLPPEVTVDPASLPRSEQPARLPQSVTEAVAALRADDILPMALGEELLEAFIAVREAEAGLFADASPDEVAARSRWVY